MLCTIGYKMFWSARLTVADSTDWQVHEVFEFLFCHSGSGRVMIGKNVVDLYPRCMILIVPGARHRLTFEAGQSADLKVVCITAQDTARYLSPVQTTVLKQLQALGYTSSSSTEIPQLDEFVRLIPEGSVVGDQRELLKVWGVISLLLASYAEDGSPVTDEVRQQRRRNRVQDICAWLDKHLDQETSLDEIALEFGLSRSLLTRTFRRHTGTSIVHYVNARRLERAAVLLTSSSDRSVSETALESGFSNLSNFHRRFKAAYGLTPAEFRENFSSQQ